MGIIVHKGAVTHSDEFDIFENFAAENKTKVKSVELWGFERLAIGQVCVRWKNGAIGNFVAGNLADLRDYVASIDGWPEATLYPRTLPHEAGLLFMAESSAEQQEKPGVENHAVRHVVRHRHSEARRRRVRAEA